VHIFADIVESFEVEDAAIQLSAHFFGLLQRSRELFELDVEVFFGQLNTWIPGRIWGLLVGSKGSTVNP
jgi:hypothetical protein